jgi:hypothetical protein
MSTDPTQAPAPSPTAEREVVVYRHSQLFYWWPVWAVGFILWGLSYFSGTRLAVVPSDAKAYDEVTVTLSQGDELKSRNVIVTDKQLVRDPTDEKEPAQPHIRIATKKSYGVLFAIVLLLVIVITNVPLRGLWSVVIIAAILVLALLLALFDLWETVLTWFSFLDIRINAGGYMFISVILFIMWAVTTYGFDRFIYMVFTPGQLKVRAAIGEGEQVYDARGMTLEKQRSDLFRHWGLGIGSGDLIVRTSGAQSHYFEFPNVLFVGRKVKRIEDMMKRAGVGPGE